MVCSNLAGIFLHICKNVCNGYLYIDVYLHIIIKVHHILKSFCLVSCVVCFHDEVNVTVRRCLHDFGEEVYINYTVERNTSTPTPIAIDVYQLGNTKRTAFRCESGSIADLVRIVFAEGCKDPVVIVNKTATVNLSVDVEVTLSYMDMLCNTILIGPQREYSCSACRVLCQPVSPLYASYSVRGVIVGNIL